MRKQNLIDLKFELLTRARSWSCTFFLRRNFSD